MKPRLYYLVRKAAHFSAWERAEFARYFDLVDEPDPGAALLSFGPDVLDEAAGLPASRRFAVLFPGFSYNPVRNLDLRAHQLHVMNESFSGVFVNPGPLEIAYAGFDRLTLYPFSVDTDKVGFRRYRDRLDSLVHVSHDNPQKDWQRSASVMAKTGLRSEVFPPRDPVLIAEYDARARSRDRRRRRLGLRVDGRLPSGYFSHEEAIARYHAADGFVHVAREVGHPEFIDGKVTASMIEAGVTGALLFWHDTWGLGNGLETVFALPVDTAAAAEQILDIRFSIDIARQSRLTRDEMLSTFSVSESVGIRARAILEDLETR